MGVGGPQEGLAASSSLPVGPVCEGAELETKVGLGGSVDSRLAMEQMLGWEGLPLPRERL